MKAWVVYILSCKDGSLYTGITNDLSKRLDTHNKGIGAKYTASRLPVILVYVEASQDRSTASIREAVIKKMNRNNKLKLVYME